MFQPLTVPLEPLRISPEGNPNKDSNFQPLTDEKFCDTVSRSDSEIYWNHTGNFLAITEIGFLCYGGKQRTHSQL